MRDDLSLNLVYWTRIRFLADTIPQVHLIKRSMKLLVFRSKQIQADKFVRQSISKFLAESI